MMSPGPLDPNSANSTIQQFNNSTIRPSIIAHRGARAFAPENTLEAIDKAAALGADMVELDVQLSSDLELVVFHDDTLDRCSNVRQRFPGRSSYLVQAFSRAELQGLDAGSWFVRVLEDEPSRRPAFLQSVTAEEIEQFISPEDRARYRSGQVRPPTLEQALVRANQLGLRVNVELKVSPAGVAAPAPLQENNTPPQSQPHPSPPSPLPSLARGEGRTSSQRSLVDRAVELIGRLGLCDRLLVSSFDHTSLRRVKELQPKLATAALVQHRLADPVRYCQDLRANAYHPGYYGDDDVEGFGAPGYLQTGRLPAEPIRRLRDAGIDVNVWTENDPSRMRSLIEAGVSGIITDYPNRLVELLSC